MEPRIQISRGIESFLDYLRETEQQFDLLLNGMERCLVEQNRYSRLVSDIRTFCIRNLSDNTLGGQMISDRFHLSVTYLNQLSSRNYL